MAESIKTYLLDTNVILRFLAGDIPKQQKQANLWFRQAETRKRKIIVSPIVIAESCFVLESFYKKKRIDIAEAFESFLSQKWLTVEYREVLLGVWKKYSLGQHFVDSFLLSYSEVHSYSLLTFDKAMQKSKGHMK
jgi:predicted nucleic-acid-binding protein